MQDIYFVLPHIESDGEKSRWVNTLLSVIDNNTLQTERRTKGIVETAEVLYKVG